MEAKIFNIPSYNLEILEKKLKKLNKKAARAGTGAIKLTKVSQTVENMGDGTVQIFHQVAIEGETPKIAGWTFVARLDHNDDPSGQTNFVYVMPSQSLDEQHRCSGANCEHCGYKRKRRDTYFLRNDVSGELKQVGRTCVQDFIGIDPEKVVSQAERLFELGRAAEEAEKNSGSLGVPYDKRHIVLDDFLAYTAKAIRKHGWVSTKQAFEGYGVISTRDLVLNMMFASYRGYSDLLEKPEPEDVQKAQDAADYAMSLVASASEYNHNVQTMLKTGYIDFKASGIAASIIRIYDLHLAKEAEQKSKLNLSTSDYVGEVGAKIRGKVRIISKKRHEGYYGITNIVRMVSVNKNDLIVTFATGAFDPEIGSEIEIRGTVKKHEVYNNVKQTVLSRVKIA